MVVDGLLGVLALLGLALGVMETVGLALGVTAAEEDIVAFKREESGRRLVDVLSCPSSALIYLPLCSLVFGPGLCTVRSHLHSPVCAQVLFLYKLMSLLVSVLMTFTPPISGSHIFVDS